MKKEFFESPPLFVKAGWDFLAISREVQFSSEKSTAALLAQCEGHPAVIIQRSTKTREIKLACESAPLSISLRGPSVKRFEDEPIPFKALCGCLAESCGPRQSSQVVRNGYHFFQVPSAGNLVATSVWLAARNVVGVNAGIYFLERATLSLREYRTTKSDLFRAYGSLVQEELRQAGALLFIAVSFDRLYSKYGARGFRLGFLEAGHLGQALYASAHRHELCICAVAGYIEEEINEVLHLDGKDHSVVYCLAIGKAKNST